MTTWVGQQSHRFNPVLVTVLPERCSQIQVFSKDTAKSKDSNGAVSRNTTSKLGLHPWTDFTGTNP